MDWNILADSITLIVLVGVFTSLSWRRANDDASRVWLVADLNPWIAAWLLIVVHFIAMLCDPTGQSVPAQLIAIATLQIAGVLFVRGVGSRYPDAARAPLFVVVLAPNLALGVLAVCSVEARLPYVIVLASTVVVCLAVARLYLPDSKDRVAIIGAMTTIVLPTAAVLLFAPSPTLTLVVSLGWIFLFASWKFSRRAARYTVGVGTTLFGFAAWGLVFPVGFATQTLWPNVHIDGTTWNIPKYLVAIGIIVTLLEEQIERTRYLAFHDDVTRLPNRRALEDRLLALIERRANTPFALLVIELDRFEAILEGLGFCGDDDLLRAVAGRLNGELGPNDLCARRGHHDFVVILDAVDGRGEAERRARRMLAALALPIDVHGETVTVDANVGVALYPEHGADPEALRSVAAHEAFAVKRMRQVGYVRG